MNRITLVTKTGIVNDYEILDGDNGTNLIQLMWNGEIRCTIKGLNPKSTLGFKSIKMDSHIRIYQSVYLNGIQLVRNGRMVDLPWWKFWRKY